MTKKEKVKEFISKNWNLQGSAHVEHASFVRTAFEWYFRTLKKIEEARDMGMLTDREVYHQQFDAVLSLEMILSETIEKDLQWLGAYQMYESYVDHLKHKREVYELFMKEHFN